MPRLVFNVSLVCFVILVTANAVAQDVIFGTFTWPDSGVSIFEDPNIPNEGTDVRALAVHSDGYLYVGGTFDYVNRQFSPGIARWNGSEWTPIGTAAEQSVEELHSGTTGLYVGGSFLEIGGQAIPRLARWDGKTWSGLGSGVNANVRAILETFENGQPVLYVGGNFFTAGGLTVRGIARWDGANWSALGGGVHQGHVNAIAIFDDGTGPAVYVTGFFNTASGKVVRNVAKWDGNVWSGLGDGIANGAGNALAVFDDGTGPALYLGGVFEQIDDLPAHNIARWNGTAWSPVGDLQALPGDVLSLKVRDDGDGPKLYAAGLGVLHRWNGTRWTKYEPMEGYYWDLEFYDWGHGPQLHVGGANFRTCIARFERGFACGDFNRDGVVDQQDLGILLGSYDCDGPGCQGDADGDGDTDQADLGILLANFGQKCG